MDIDFLLIQRMKLGDDGAIENFVTKYYPKILRYCHLHITDFGHAEDVAQETFEKFFRSLNQYQHYGKAVNYLYVIAGNTCKDYYKKKREFLIDDMEEQPMTDLSNLEDKIAIKMAMNQLPQELKEITILFFFEQLKQKEIAHILGIGLPLVKYRVKKSKELLTCYLGKED